VPSRARLVDLIGHLAGRAGLATVIVSHDLDDAESLASRLVLLREGRVTHDGAVPAGLGA
jgi:ABC-type phosphonate transport system ATPase subunit